MTWDSSPARAGEVRRVLAEARRATKPCTRRLLIGTPCETGWTPYHGGTHEDAHVITAIMAYAETRARTHDTDEEVVHDPWVEACERHAEEMGKHPDSIFAIHREHGIVVRADTGEDLKAKLDALAPEVRENVLITSGAYYAPAATHIYGVAP